MYVCFLSVLFLGLLHLRKFVVCGDGAFGGCIVHQRTPGLASPHVSTARQYIMEKFVLPPNPTNAVFFLPSKEISLNRNSVATQSCETSEDKINRRLNMQGSERLTAQPGERYIQHTPRYAVDTMTCG
jgi:hypothetical protein